MSNIVVGDSLHVTQAHRQHRLSAIKSLHLGFLVHVQHHCFVGGIQVEADDILEEAHCQGRIWIDMQEVESADQVEDLIDQLTGRGDAPYPDSWITEGSFAAVSARGLGPHLSALASDTDDPWSETLADLADALQLLEPAEHAAFLAWVEEGGSTHWLPVCKTHYVEDALKRFHLSSAGPQ